MPHRKHEVMHTFISCFNNCFFLYLLNLAAITSNFIDFGVDYEFIPIINAFSSVFVTLILYHFFKRKRYFKMYSRRFIKPLVAMSFFTGILTFYMATNYIATYAIAIFIIILNIKSLGIFSAKVVRLLDIDVIATTKDMIDFFDYYINLILTFTVINFALYTASKEVGNGDVAFNFSNDFSPIIDSLYFTTIAMTSVGFGDITPNFEIAKLVVAFECLVSYIMFALMIGVLSRGINLKKTY